MRCVACCSIVGLAATSVGVVRSSVDEELRHMEMHIRFGTVAVMEDDEDEGGGTSRTEGWSGSVCRLEMMNTCRPPAQGSHSARVNLGNHLQTDPTLESDPWPAGCAGAVQQVVAAGSCTADP